MNQTMELFLMINQYNGIDVYGANLFAQYEHFEVDINFEFSF